jgi:calcium-dependent protein kinase
MSGVAYIHGIGIVHRDLKLENVLFLTEEPNSPIKIIDFGFSVFMGKNNEMSKEKESESQDPKKGGFKRLKSKVGTLYYISPEIIKGNYDEKCDIWACGVILYILLAGYPPFTGNTDKEVYNLITNLKYDFDKEHWKNISKHAKDLIKNMLIPAKNRYSAKQVLACKWFEVKLKDIDDTSNSVFDYRRINKYKSYNKLKKAILTFIASRLSNEESTNMRNIFLNIDENKNGFISFEDFRKYVINEYDIDDLFENEQELKNGFEGVDIDKNDRIDYTEFLAANLDEKIFLKNEKLKEAFRIFDINDNGAIKRDDIIRVLKLENFDNKNELADKIIEENDFDKDGKINFGDFVKIMENTDNYDI